MKKISGRVTSNKSKHLLVENELKKLKKFDSSYFRGKEYLEENYLIFKPMNKYFKKIANTKIFCHGNLKDSKLKYINKKCL